MKTSNPRGKWFNFFSYLRRLISNLMNGIRKSMIKIIAIQVKRLLLG